MTLERERQRRPRVIGLALAATLTVAVLASVTAEGGPVADLRRLWDGVQAAHPNALWHIVHDLCVTDKQASGNPAPCADVDLAGGYAIVKDPGGQTQYLLVPTARISGIESPQLLEKGSPNYWAAAWSARRWIDHRLGRPIPREDIALAVNSIPGRTQNQLHIHIDCVRPDVRDALKSHIAALTSRWGRGFVLAGRRYRARWISGADLGAHDPFKLLAAADPAARADMGRETLVLIGAARPDGAPGFVLLSDRAEAGGPEIAVGERLLDHHCQVLAQGQG